MLLHHSKLSSLASCLAFDWLLALANSHKSENLVKYSVKESLREKNRRIWGSFRSNKDTDLTSILVLN